MPYVKQERRPALDSVVREMIAIEFDVQQNLRIYLEALFESRGIGGPYERRHISSNIINLTNLSQQNNVQYNGDLNYILYKLCLITVTPSYNNYKKYIGTLEDIASSVTNSELGWELRECAAEIRRTLLGPYEDLKKKENGSVEK